MPRSERGKSLTSRSHNSLIAMAGKIPVCCLRERSSIFPRHVWKEAGKRKHLPLPVSLEMDSNVYSSKHNRKLHSCRWSQVSSGPRLGWVCVNKKSWKFSWKELPSSERVGHGDKKRGYFRTGCRKPKVKLNLPCTFKLLGVRYIEYAGDWERKEFAELRNSIGCSCSNYWPGSNLPPTCLYRSQQLVLVLAWDMLLCSLHAFSSGKLIREIREEYIHLRIYIYIYSYTLELKIFMCFHIIMWLLTFCASVLVIGCFKEEFGSCDVQEWQDGMWDFAGLTYVLPSCLCWDRHRASISGLLSEALFSLAPVCCGHTLRKYEAFIKHYLPFQLCVGITLH